MKASSGPRWDRRVTAGVACLVAFLGAAACAQPGQPTAQDGPDSGAPVSAVSASPTPSPVVSTVAPTPTPTPVVTTSASTQVPAPQPTHSYANALTLTLSSSVSGKPTLHMGGAPYVFTVNIVNDTASSSSPPSTLVVSIGMCTCSTGPIPIAPTGAMGWDQNGVWTSIPYDREGTGMDYLGVVQGFGDFLIPSGDALHFTLRVSLDPNGTQPTYVNGISQIHVTLVQLDHTFFPGVPAAGIPINVATS
jgi:hypothetical protein